jgi:RND family efflux transporter MFP subunit
MNNWWKIGTLMIAVAALAAVAGCGRKHEPGADERSPVKVETLQVEMQRTPEIHEVVGTVRAKMSANVSAKVMANIKAIHVKAGDVVAMGQPLAELDDRELRAEFERAKADYDRFKGLLERQAVTRAEFETVEARFRVAEAALSHATILAPFDGIVTQKLCEMGDLATPGRTLFVVEFPYEFQLEANVPERFAGAVRVGTRMHVVVDATGEKCVGTVSEVEPAADPASRSFLVKIDLECRQPLKSGMFGRAEIITGERFGMFVPRDAVYQRGQLTYVYVAENDRARMRLVRTGREYLGAVEILSGLQSGERVITGASGELTDGSPVDER